LLKILELELKTHEKADQKTDQNGQGDERKELLFLAHEDDCGEKDTDDGKTDENHESQVGNKT
jgi:hypothetical protein